ncbi:hypothetical protein M758_5G118000 [Ceratodon purpureus]|nr:hypothetical protein M758_5G118000 [Ceratodon purpureus]
MTSQGRKCLYWTLAAYLCLQIISFGLVHAQEQGDDVRFDYGDGPNGPAHWGDLNVNWTKCKTGKYQSPMRITPDIMVTASRLGDLDAEYSSEPVAANISINVGYAVEVKVSPNSGLLKINGVRYRPQQFHFHLGSEHKILGHSFPMELHLVHTSEEDPNVRAVIAWLFVKGEDSPFLAQFDGKLPKPDSYPSIFSLPSITLPKLEESYARYQGSLTTPPCSEGVTWTVMLWNFPTISERQIQMFKAAMPKENVRPSMPSHGRRFRIHADS